MRGLGLGFFVDVFTLAFVTWTVWFVKVGTVKRNDYVVRSFVILLLSKIFCCLPSVVSFDTRTMLLFAGFVCCVLRGGSFNFWRGGGECSFGIGMNKRFVVYCFHAIEIVFLSACICIRPTDFFSVHWTSAVVVCINVVLFLQDIVVQDYHPHPFKSQFVHHVQQ